MSADGQPFLTARHADNVVESVQALNRTIAKDLESRVRQHAETIATQEASLAAQQATIALLAKVVEHTSGLPALVEALKTKSNGDAHHALASVAATGE